MTKVAVFPASGKLGSSISKHLVTFINPRDITLISRFPEKIPREHLQAGVTTKRADYNEPSTLNNVFENINVLVLISYPSIENDHRLKSHLAAIDSALKSRVSHIIYTSLAFGGDGEPKSAASVMQAHLRTENALSNIAAGKSDHPFTFTAIREGIYSESFGMYTAFFDLSSPVDKIRIPHNGSGPGIAWAKIDELGEATARFVEKYLDRSETEWFEEFKNKVILLSGPKEWTLAETARLLGEVAGKAVTVEEIGTDEYTGEPAVQENLSSHGPEDVPRQWVTAFQAIKDGETAVITSKLRNLLGREPEAFDVTVKAMLNK